MSMASLSIRKIDDATMNRLRLRAAGHGVSMEEEVRRIIRQAVATPERLGDLAVTLFSPAYGGDPLPLPERDTSEPLAFDGLDERS
jgi:plasmid stability protein